MPLPSGTAPPTLRYDHTIQAALSSPWAIQEEHLNVLLGILAHRVAGNAADQDTVDAAAQERRANDPMVTGAVGVLPLYGTIFPKANLMTQSSGCTSLQQFTRDFRALAAEEEVKAIVLDVDSPGGSVAGLPEAVAEFQSIRTETGKPVVAVSATLCASAAYWIAAQADEIVASPSSQTGSIGVIAIHEAFARALDAEGVDVTVLTAGRYKGEGNPYEVLGEDAQAAMQAVVDEFYGHFIDAVARGRGVPSSAVRRGYGEGRALTAARALDAGIVDRIASLNDTVGRLQRAQARNAVVRLRGGGAPPVGPAAHTTIADLLGENAPDFERVATEADVPASEDLTSAVLASMEVSP